MAKVPKFTRPDVLSAGLPAKNVQGVASKTAQEILVGLSRVDQIINKRLDDKAIVRGAEEGLEVGSEAERLELKRDGSLRSQAFNKAALTAFGARQETLLRQEHARIARQFEGDLEGLTAALGAVKQGVISSSPPELRPGLQSISDRLTLAYTERELERVEAVAQAEARAEVKNNLVQREDDIRQMLLSISDPEQRQLRMAAEIAEITQIYIANGPKQGFTFRGIDYAPDPLRSGTYSPKDMEDGLLAFESLMRQETIMGIFGRLGSADEKEDFLADFVIDFNDGQDDLVDNLTRQEFDTLQRRMDAQIKDQVSVTQAEKFEAQLELSKDIASGAFTNRTDLERRLGEMTSAGFTSNAEAQGFLADFDRLVDAETAYRTIREALDAGRGEFLEGFTKAQKQTAADRAVSESIIGVANPTQIPATIARSAIRMAEENGTAYSPFVNALRGASPGDGQNFANVAESIYLPLKNAGPDVLNRFIPDATDRVRFENYLGCIETRDRGVCLTALVEATPENVVTISPGAKVVADIGAERFGNEETLGPGLTTPQATELTDFGIAELPPPGEFSNAQQINQAAVNLAEFCMLDGLNTREQCLAKAFDDIKGSWVQYGDLLIPNFAIKDDNGVPLDLSAGDVRSAIDFYNENMLPEFLLVNFPNEAERPLEGEVFLAPDGKTGQDGRLVLWSRIVPGKVQATNPDGTTRTARISIAEMHKRRREEVDLFGQQEAAEKKLRKRLRNEPLPGALSGGRTPSRDEREAVRATVEEEFRVRKANQFPERKDLVETDGFGVFDLNRLRRAIDNPDDEMMITVEVNGQFLLIPSFFDDEIKPGPEALELAIERRDIIGVFDSERAAAAFARKRSDFMNRFKSVEELIDFLKRGEGAADPNRGLRPGETPLAESILFDG